MDQDSNLTQPTKEQQEAIYKLVHSKVELIEIPPQEDIDNRFVGYKNVYDIINEVWKIAHKSPTEVQENVYEINFDGHVLCKIRLVNNQPTVEAAMNGWGNSIDSSRIIVTETFKGIHIP